VEASVVYSNAAAAVKRAPVRCKEIKLPSIDKFNALIAEMRAGHSRDSINCADFASGLAFTGCRISEAREIAWRFLILTRAKLLCVETQPPAQRIGDCAVFR
jgi:integrase